MTKIPVLFLISSNIDLTVLNHSPRFQKFHFFSLTAMDYLGNDSSKRKTQMLWSVLNRKIERVKAQYLIAHLGLAFDRYPVEFLTALLNTYSLHPQLKIGLDKGLNYAIQYLRMTAVPHSEAKRLIAQLAQHRSVFCMNEETAALATCLY